MEYMQLTVDMYVAAGDVGAWEAMVEKVAMEVEAKEATATATSLMELM